MGEKKKKITKGSFSVRKSHVQIRQDQLHGKQVASDSTPISSSNIGHRMLAAMGLVF